MADIETLQEKILAFRDARDWQQFHNPKDLTISLVLEATELLEHFQWKNDEAVKRHIQDHSDEIADEVIDTLYWLLLIAHELDIDIDKAFARKMKKNEAKYPVEKAKGSPKKFTKLDV